MSIPARRILAACIGACLSGPLFAQAPSAPAVNLSSAQSPYYGSVTTAKATGGIEPLSLDDAIRMGLDHNLGLIEALAQQKQAHGQALRSLQPLLPTVTAEADTGARQINLAAQGFSSSVVGEISQLFPGRDFSNVSLIVKVDTTDASVNYSQTLFDFSNIERYRAAKALTVSAYYGTQSARGLVILNVGDSYLQTLAAGARVDNARALLRADRLTLDQTIEKHTAGTVAKLDELRARVSFENQQQDVIAVENRFAKAKIALNREIGLSAEQQIQLTDAVPYSDLEVMGIDEAKRTAYQNRQDYQGLMARIRAAQLEHRAAKWERLPSLKFNGNYGVTGVTHGLYHGTFAAVGSIEVPLFDEAKFRGDRETAAANLAELTDEFDSLKQQIDQQVRDSILDVQANGELVRVARSNVDLAQQALEQTRERFQAGVDDNLPVVEAQARLSAAQSHLVDVTVQYNQAKLGLARNLGVVEGQYNTFLRGK